MEKKGILEDHTFTGDHVPKLTKILFPWSGVFRDACYTLIGSYLMQYAINAGVLSTDPDVFQAQYGVITIAMIICLIWDGINDPIMGFILEKAHFRSGKFRPWIEIGALGNSLCVALMFLIPYPQMGWGYVGFMIAMYVLWDLFFTMNDIGYWSMLPALTSDPKERASLTTQTTIAASVGTFLMSVLMVLLQGGRASMILVYRYAGLGVALFFLLTQTVVFFLCKEKKRDPKQEEVSEHSSILDLFRILGKNSQLRVCAIALLLFYFSEFILTGIGQNYFYMVFGYGSSKGGIVAVILSVIYVLGTMIAQAFYPLLIKKLSKQKILTLMVIVIVAAYVVFFFVGFPLFGEHPIAYNTVDSGNIGWAFGGTMFLYYLTAFLFFAATGVFYLALMVMFQDAIDYGEWKTGERKEAISFAWRPLDVKLASGLNRGLQWITYVSSGTLAFVNTISNAEGTCNANAATEGREAAEKIRDETIESARGAIGQRNLVIMGVIIIGVIVASSLASYFLLHFGFKIDEKKRDEINEELKKRHQADEEALKARA